MKLIYVLLFIAAAFCVGLMLGVTGMQQKAPVPATEKDDYKVELLFTKDGCSIYRFRDTQASTYIKHFARCGTTGSILP